MEANLGHVRFEEDDVSYVTLDAEGDEVAKWIPKHQESFQLMHHVAIRDVWKGLMLVGCEKKVMFGIVVTYSDRLIHSYQAILRDLFNRVLMPLYEPSATLQLPYKKIDAIIKSDAMKKIGLSLHSFMTNYYIWRRIRLEGDIKLPVPACNRCIPYNHSIWNDMKGASDTATKLFWNCQSQFASYRKSQTVAIARYFQLFCVAIH